MEFCCFFWGVSNEILCNPLARTDKKKHHHVAYHIKENYRKMSSDFPENSTNCQNHDIFEGALIGRRIFSQEYSAIYPKLRVYQSYTVRN